ncbi:MAG: TRAP transporter substrate-binding protein DctP [Gracilibacteraceae bacterium]|jgi:TRAP-type C4-dicarboxylate transport system substrate-binding protein|nr:TRAP transporter substrate-binding protein DctP [Gracilibacteraceae bacterium]
MMKASKKFWIVLLCITFVAGMTLAGCGGGGTAGGNAAAADPGAAEKVFKWRLVTHQTPGTARYDATVIPFCETVKTASNGRLIIEPFGGGALFPVSDSLDQIMNGVVEMGAIWSGYWGGKDPIFNLAGGIPGDPLYGFEEHCYRVEQQDPILRAAYEKYGVTYLGMFDYAGRDILMSNKPVRSVEDFRGLNVRTSGIGAEFYKALGANGVSVPGGEVYTAMQLGTVDAAEYNDWIVNKEMGFDEVTSYVIEPSMHNGVLSDKDLIVNPKAWNELPDDLKAIVLAARDGARYNSSQKFGVMSKLSATDWREEGVEVIELPEADVARMEDIAFEFLLNYKNSNPSTVEFVEKYAEVLNDLGYTEQAQKLGYGG